MLTIISKGVKKKILPIYFVYFYKFLITVSGEGPARPLLETKHKTEVGLRIRQELEIGNARGSAPNQKQHLFLIRAYISEKLASAKN